MSIYYLHSKLMADMIHLSFFPSDIIRYIFMICPISDKRSFIRTCKSFSSYAILMLEIEKEFQKMILETKFFYSHNFTGFSNPLYKYTIELVYDNYDHLIPDKYIIPENRILHQYKKIYYRAGLRGNLSMIQRFLKLDRNNYDADNADFAMRGAAESGSVHILEWMELNNYKFNEWTSARAVKGNQFVTLKWLNKHGCLVDDLCVRYSAKTGNIKILEWLLNKKKGEVNWNVAYDTSCKGHIDVIKFLYKKNIIKKNEAIYYGASQGGHVNILEWVFKKNNDFEICEDKCEEACEGASFGGHIHILEWFKRNNLFDNKWTCLCDEAVNGGNFRCLKWLVENGCPLDEKVCDGAIRKGNVEMVEWLFAKGYKFDMKRAYISVAENGFLDMLKWLVGKGYKMSFSISRGAAEGGHLELLQWAVANGCPMDMGLISNAVRNGHLDLVKWVLFRFFEEGINLHTLNTEACVATVVHNHLDILKWLRATGFQWDEAVCAIAVQYKNLDILQWAIENGCEWRDHTYDLATIGKCKDKNGKLVKYLFQNKVLDKRISDYLDMKLKEKK